MPTVPHTRLCTIDGCERELRARGWCGTHWKRWKTSGDPLKVAGCRPRECQRCSSSFTPEYPRTLFCDTCIEVNKREAEDARFFDCAVCGSRTESAAANQKSCMPCRKEFRKIGQKAWVARNPEYHSEYKRRPEYMEQARAYSRQYREDNLEKCRESFKRWEAANPNYGREWESRNRTKARQKVQRRRARIREATVLEFTADRLDARWDYYGRKCWVCKADATATDHVKPLNKGGPHMLANLRPICGPCNSGKRDTWPVDTRVKR